MTATLDLAAFVPPVVRELLASGAGVSGQDCARFEAALLFADAEGFSRMSTVLVAQDTRGAEEIGAILNRHFERIGALVEAAGGTLTAFAGDAICALWPLRGGDRRAAVLAAAAAGRAIEAMHAEPGAELRFRAAVDVGDVLLWHLGGNDRRGAILAGPLFDGLPALSQLSAQGRLTLTPRAQEVAAGNCRVRAVPGGFVVEALDGPPAIAPAAAPPPLADAETFLPPLLVRVLATAGADWAAELSLASVLFARLSAAAAGTPDFPCLRRALSRASAEIEALGGLLLQTVMDDKGLVLVAVWGLSFNRTETDAGRAVRAARAIDAAARDEGLAAGIGIRAGRVFAGVVGGGSYRQYAVIGAAMNEAAWLMQRAAGTILVDAATRDAALARFRFRAAGEIAWKGTGVLEPVFVPEAPLAAPAEAARGRLIGREAELARLETLLTAGQAPLLWITGEAGIGKSHLAGRARTIVAERGYEQIATAADSLTRDRPYGAMRHVFMQLLGCAGEDDGAAQVDALARAVAEPEQLALVAAALGLAEAPVPGGVSELARQAQRMREALLSVLERCIGERPLVLHVEDAHWLDTASWQLLAAARVRLPRFGLVLVARPVDPLALPAEARALHDGPQAAHLALGPLSPEAAAALVAEAIGAASIPAGLASRVHARTEGHPYYTRELAAAIVRAGALRVADGICHVAMGAEELDTAFPESIGAAIASRFAELDPAAQLTLRVASVEGREFFPDDVAAVRPPTHGRATVEAHLAAAQALSLVEPDPRRPGGLRFYHALAREAVYGLLTEAQRRQLHAAVAARQEARGAAADPDRHSLLAHHWAAAGDGAVAIRYLDSAAARAEAAGSHVEVVKLLRRAQRLAESGKAPSAPGWDDRIGRALFHLGNVRGSIEHMERAVTPVTGPLPRGVAIAPRLVAEFARIRFARPGPAALAGERERILAAADACLRLSYQHYEVQNLPAAMLASFLTVNLGRRAGAANVPLALGLANLAVASLSAPFLLDGLRHRDLAVAMAEELGAHDGLFWIGIGASTFDLAQGRFGEAERLVDRAIAVAREHMGARDWEMAVSHKANLMRTMGRHREGGELDGLTLASSRDRGLVLGRIWGLTGRCKSLYWTGEIEAFRAELAELKALIADADIAANTSRNNALSAAAAEANLALLEGDTARALERIGAALRLFSGVRDPQYYMEDVPGYVSDALLRAWQLDRTAPVVPLARANLKAARRIARLYPVARGRLSVARGDLALFDGRPDRAHAHWSRARGYAAARGLGAAEAQALVRGAMPELCAGSDRVEAAARVDAIFAGLGAETPFHWRQIMDGA